MTSTLATRLSPALRPHAVRRAIIAGSLWGIGMGAALTALKFQSCGIVCLSDITIDTATAVMVGILGIGPLAAFSRA